MTDMHGCTNQHGYTDRYGKLLEERLSYQIRKCFYNVVNKYGRGLKEIIYQKALEEEFGKQGLKYSSQHRIKIHSLETGKVLGTYIPDFIIEEKIIIEIKSSILTTIDNINQQRQYLKASMYEIAYLVNFGTPKIDIKRSIFTNDRKPFVVLLNHNPSLRENPSLIRVDPSFTLLEITIVITLIAALAVTGIVLMNPAQQTKRSTDTKRKNELHALQKAFEDFYNDKSSYPKPAEVCFDTPTSSRTDTYGKTACTCQICGNNPSSPSFPYMPRLTCDPQSPAKEFLYDYDCAQTNPQWYRIYTKLSYLADADRKAVGCEYGCGPAPNYAYHYAVLGPNTSPEISYCADSLYLYYKRTSTQCDICKSPATGDTCDYGLQLYIDDQCTTSCHSP